MGIYEVHQTCLGIHPSFLVMTFTSDVMKYYTMVCKGLSPLPHILYVTAITEFALMFFLFLLF